MTDIVSHATPAVASSASRDPSVRVVLASTSASRRELLSRVLSDFDVAAPDVDETAHPGESITATARRLSIAKAEAVAARQPGALVIGSDQLGELDGEPIGKPGNFENALAQLQRLRGRSAGFHTGVCLIDTRSGRRRDAVISTRVTFRSLPDHDLADYLRLDRPWDCAGSARSEGLGMTIIERIETDDPSALVGLPVLTVIGWLRDAGHPIYPRP
jgi:septum formation protein